MKVEPRKSLDHILECAVTDNWPALMRAAESGLIHIDYGFGPRDSIEYLKLWISTARGHWFLACEYWMSTSKFHTSGIHFENGYKSDDLAHNLEWIMQHQAAFSLPPNLGRNGLIQIQTPTEAEIAAATVSLSEALDRITDSQAESSVA
jgi:hypothetical protein